MKPKFKQLYTIIATEVAKMSHAKRLQVGAIVVKDGRIISMGYNGMPSGWENDCEDKEWMGDAGGLIDPDEIKERWPFEGEYYDGIGRAMKDRFRLKTRAEVLHAESNAIAKLAKSNDSGDAADLFVTHSPCMDCAKLIYQSGISRVFYSEDYRDDAGIKFLKQSGVEVIKND